MSAIGAESIENIAVRNVNRSLVANNALFCVKPVVFASKITF